MKKLKPEELVVIINKGLPINDDVLISGRVAGVEEIKYQYPKTEFDRLQNINPKLIEQMEKYKPGGIVKSKNKRLKPPKEETPIRRHYFFEYNGDFSLTHIDDSCIHLGSPHEWAGSRTTIDRLVIKSQDEKFRYAFVKEGDIFVNREGIYIPIESVRKTNIILQAKEITY